MRQHRLLSFVLHVTLVLAFVAASGRISKHYLPSIMQASTRSTKDEEKASQGRPPLTQRPFHPAAFDKATDAIKKFEACESSFLEDCRHRKRIYLNAVEQSSRCMKHLYRLKRALPNDMAAENRLDYFMDFIGATMTNSLLAMARRLKKKHTLHHHAHADFPFASNMRE
jgi:hypothetical protein